MKLFKIDYKNPDPELIEKAANVIKKGGIVIVPTETVYAILGDGLNIKTVRNLLKLKKRNENKGFDLTLHPYDKIFDYAKYSPLVPEILDKFPDQPLSFALPRKKSLPSFLNADFDTVAFHFFFSKIDEELFKHIDTPLIGTSANISKLPDTGSIKKVIEYFKHTLGTSFEPDLILDGGEIPKHKPSAIIEIVDKKIEIIRNGDMPQEMLQKELKKLMIRVRKNMKKPTFGKN